MKLALGATLTVAAAVVPTVFLATTRHYKNQLELAREQVQREGELVQIALEHQMLHNDRSLIKELVQKYSGDSKAKHVLLFDHAGRLRFFNDPAMARQTFDRRTSPACQVCHARPAAQRLTSAVVDLAGGQFLRHVVPIRNRPPCYRCHDASHAINGVLIIDSSLEAMQARLRADVWRLALGAAVVALLLLAGITLLVRRLLLRPLIRLATATRRIAAGDFTERAPARGTSPLAQLGQEFNDMADALSELVAETERQRAQLENVANSVSDGLLVIDATFTVVAVNRSLADRLGVPREQILLRRCHAIWGETNDECRSCEGGAAAATACPGARCLASGRVETAIRTRRDATTGKERQDEVFASPIFDQVGNVVQVAEVWRDITERKSHEARMAEVQRFASLGMLASGFSHEINTPLGTILFCAEDLRRRLRTDAGDDAAAQIDLIRSEVSRCQKITQQFLRLSRGGSAPKPYLLDLPPTIRAVLPLAEPTARKHGVRLTFAEPQSERVPVVLANDGTVQQVLLNLIVNAVQASAPGSEVHVACSTGDGEVRVQVVDGGIGMAPDVRARIFEPFFTATPGGTGLGLFVSLNLARQWGGDIRVATEPGKGSTFEVTFPRQDRPGQDEKGP